MQPIKLRLLTFPERQRMTQQCSMMGADIKTWFTPGLAWYNHAFCNPLNKKRTAAQKERGLRGDSFLSVNYWRDWAEIRPPIVIVVPGGDHWCPDFKSSNDWVVTGDLISFPPKPGDTVNFTVTPSAKMPGYDGQLVNGELT
jgi:hypothetical protein